MKNAHDGNALLPWHEEDKVIVELHRAWPPSADLPCASARFLPGLQPAQGLLTNRLPLCRRQLTLGALQSVKQACLEQLLGLAFFVSADQFSHVFARAAVAALGDLPVHKLL